MLDNVANKFFKGNKNVAFIVIAAGGMVLFILLIVLIASLTSGGIKSYSQLEDKLVNAAEKYYKDNSDKLPLTDGTVSVTDSTLVEGNYIKELSKLYSKDKCTATVEVVKNGDGSKLLLDLPKAYEIIKEVVKSVSIPVTVKFRKGWDNDNIVAVDMAKVAEDAGASAITIHGRTRSEFYSGTADWNIIKSVKENVNIPVIGNGDIKNVDDAKRIFELTGVDAIMIGRASLGRPWIFKEITSGLQGEPFEISNEQKLKLILEQLNLEIKDKGERVAIMEMRKHIGWYIKNTKDASKVREYVNQITDKDVLIETLSEYFMNIN